MRTSSAKAKGRRCSQEVKELLLASQAELSEDDILVTPSGVTGVDLHLSPKAKSVYPFAIECKNQERIQVWAALEQSESHVGGNEIPVLFFKRNRSKLYVALSADQFIRLLKREGQ